MVKVNKYWPNAIYLFGVGTFLLIWGGVLARSENPPPMEFLVILLVMGVGSLFTGYLAIPTSPKRRRRRRRRHVM